MGMLHRCDGKKFLHSDLMGSRLSVSHRCDGNKFLHSDLMGSRLSVSHRCDGNKFLHSDPSSQLSSVGYVNKDSWHRLILPASHENITLSYDGLSPCRFQTEIFYGACTLCAFCTLGMYKCHNQT